MKKSGFTLVELLVSIAIIGVVAALCMPMFSDLLPDKKKALYIKTYKNLSQLTADLLNDPSVYWTEYDDSGNVVYEGLSSWVISHNTTTGLDGSSQFKYTYNLIGKMQGKSPEKGKDMTITDSFRTIDGIEWTFSGGKNRGNSTKNSPNYKEEITINFAPDSDNNQCTYSSDCTNPNEFKFEVDNWGNVKPADALGMVYLRNQDKLNSTSEDKELAAKVVSTANSDSDITKMESALNKLKTSSETDSE